MKRPDVRRISRLLAASTLSALASAALASLATAAPARAVTKRPAGRGGQAAPRGKTPLASAGGISLVHGARHGATFVTSEAPVGLSFEYPTLAAALGSTPCGPGALIAELRRLGSPPLRVGGNSQDLTAPAGALAGPQPSWEAATVYSLPASFWTQLHCLLGETHDPLSIGLNAKIGSLAWAQQMVASAAAAATNGVEYSIGNEPDLYYLPDYSSLGHNEVDDEAAAVSTYLRVAESLAPATAGDAVIGPELARASSWRRQLPRLIDGLHLHTLGVHLYPLSACVAPPSIAQLLSPAAGSAPAALWWVVADAEQAHIPAIISEANSAACGGAPGVSDTPAAAVWAMRFVLAALKTGFAEVRFHFSGGAYDPFVIAGSRLTTRPLETALVALNRWLAPGTVLQNVTGIAGIVATAVQSSPAGIQLIVDNERESHRRVLLTGASSVHVQELSPARAGLVETVLHARHGHIALGLAPESVAAISP